jgi:ParB family chromosome partitioning protein
MAKAASRLGRGLSSLITVREEIPTPPSTNAGPAAPPMEPVKDASTGAPLVIPVAAVVPNPHQPRRSFSDSSLVELASSLRTNGMIQPILVRREGDRYELIAGERRWRAAKLAGMTEIPAIVRDVDGLTQAQLALVENIQREDLNPIDRALGYRTLMNQLGLTQSELAGRLGEERSGIANFLRLLDLAEPLQAYVADGRLSVGHGKVLAGVSDPAEQTRLADLVISQGLSVRNLERLIQEPTSPPPAKSAPASPAAHIAQLERNIARQLGMKVQIKTTGAKGKGRLTVHYSSLDQFDELMQRLHVAVD